MLNSSKLWYSPTKEYFQRMEDNCDKMTKLYAKNVTKLNPLLHCVTFNSPIHSSIQTIISIFFPLVRWPNQSKAVRIFNRVIYLCVLIRNCFDFSRNILANPFSHIRRKCNIECMEWKMVRGAWNTKEYCFTIHLSSYKWKRKRQVFTREKKFTNLYKLYEKSTLMDLNSICMIYKSFVLHIIHCMIFCKLSTEILTFSTYIPIVLQTDTLNFPSHRFILQ